MAQKPLTSKKQLVTKLQSQVTKLQSELSAAKAASGTDQYIQLQVQDTDIRYKKVRNPKGPDTGTGTYLVIVDVHALSETIYLPISIASGRVSTGFVFQTEGTAKAVTTATIATKGSGVLKVTAGSILYAKIEPGKKVTFKILAQIQGGLGKEYTLVLTRINYKRNPNDLRYRKLLTDIRTNTLKFD